MAQSNSQSLARILAAPWHQRRNTGGPWGIALVLALCFAAPLVLTGWSLLAPPDHAAALRNSAVAAVWVGVGTLLAAGWAVAVGNVLQQNHPTFARLVPRQAGQLRLALVVGWALASLAAAGLPGFAFGAPLAWGCGTAAALALAAAALRWPLLWLGGIVAPFVVGWLTRRFGLSVFEEAMRDAWREHHVLLACTVATAGAAVLVSIVRDGGARHVAGYEACQRLREAVLQQPGHATTRGVGSGCLSLLTFNSRLYTWWMTRLLAAPHSPVSSRLLVGLGPSAHWTTGIVQGLCFIAVSTLVCVLAWPFVGNDVFAAVLPWLAFSVLTGLCSPALQAVPQLQRTRREQALLVLLPGVPAGARLNRWLAWQMSGPFMLTTLCALAAAWALDGVADWLQPGATQGATGGMSAAIAAVLLPQVAWQWRHWARLWGGAGSVAQAPTMVLVSTGLGALALHGATGIGYVTVGAVLAAVAIAYCAWRWWRMGAEPTAFPVGRLR